MPRPKRCRFIDRLPKEVNAVPRPKRCRFIDRLPVYRSFSPDDIDASESVLMTVDEFETLRLLDNEGLTQKQCAARMNVSRTTVTAIYDSARKKIGDVLVNGKRLLITGGNCKFTLQQPPENLIEKGQNTMRIAVTYDNGEIFQHFGHSEYFKLYDAQNGVIVAEQVVSTNGSGHGALAGFLQDGACRCGNHALRRRKRFGGRGGKGFSRG